MFDVDNYFAELESHKDYIEINNNGKILVGTHWNDNFFSSFFRSPCAADTFFDMHPNIDFNEVERLATDGKISADAVLFLQEFMAGGYYNVQK